MKIELQIAADAPAEPLEGLPKGDHAHLCLRIVLLVQHEHTDAPHRRRLLGAGRQWASHDCRAAEQRDEASPLHSITSSARPMMASGTLRPSARAVLRLMISSTLV